MRRRNPLFARGPGVERWCETHLALGSHTSAGVNPDIFGNNLIALVEFEVFLKLCSVSFGATTERGSDDKELTVAVFETIFESA